MCVHAVSIFLYLHQSVFIPPPINLIICIYTFLFIHSYASMSVFPFSTNTNGTVNSFPFEQKQLA